MSSTWRPVPWEIQQTVSVDPGAPSDRPAHAGEGCQGAHSPASFVGSPSPHSSRMFGSRSPLGQPRRRLASVPNRNWSDGVGRTQPARIQNTLIRGPVNSGIFLVGSSGDRGFHVGETVVGDNTHIRRPISLALQEGSTDFREGRRWLHCRGRGQRLRFLGWKNEGRSEGNSNWSSLFCDAASIQRTICLATSFSQ